MDKIVYLFCLYALSPQYNHHYDVVVSGDESGMVEYWSGPASDYIFPKNVKLEHKIDTDLYGFAKVCNV